MTEEEKLRHRLYRYAVLGDIESCWLWVGTTNNKGYGQLKINKKNTGAHRVSYMVHIGPIPEGMFVLHQCDNPACINPYHLFLGTHADNMRDKVQKGRMHDQRGEHNPKAKITELQARDAHERAAKGERQSDIARSYGVTRSAISRIIRGQSWPHIYKEIYDEHGSNSNQARSEAGNLSRGRH